MSMYTSNHSTTIFKEFCKQVNLHVQQIDPSTYLANMSGKSGKWPIILYVQDTRSIFTSVLPLTISRDQRPSVMEYLTRANWGLPFGNFEMNLDEGEVRFKTSMSLVDGTLTHEMLSSLLVAHFYIVDHYLPGLLSMLFAHQSPEAAIAAVETEPDTESEQEDLNQLLNDVDVDRLLGLNDE